MRKVLKILNLDVYEVPEFLIATLENPVEILRGKFKTILTGSTDYAYFWRCKSPRYYNYIEASGSLIYYAVDWEKSDLKAFCDRYHSRGVKVLLGQLRVNGVQIFMIEAKSKEYSKNLVTCLPQMGAECIAM
jgi:hypothetical protein